MKHAKLQKSRFTDELNQAEKGKQVRGTKANFRVVGYIRDAQLMKKKGINKPKPIYLDLCLGSKRKPFSTNIKVRPSQFNTETLQITGDNHKNMMLQNLVARANQFYAELRITERSIDLSLIKSAVLGLASTKTPTAFELFDLFLQQCNQEVETRSMAVGTYKKISNWHKRFKEYINVKYGTTAAITSIVPNDSKGFVLYLKSEYDYAHNSTQMAVAHVKRVLNFGIENEWITRNRFINFRRKFEMKRLESLSELEIEKLESINLLDDRLQRANNVFLFMIYTGLSYIDLQKLRKSDIYELSSGDLYIFKERQKSQKTQTVYLTKKALKILAKYEDDSYCTTNGFLVPILSNQKINYQLKAIGAIAGIDHKLTCHLARKTFATVMYNAGANEKTMKAIMGHSTITMTLKHYAKVSQETVVQDLKDTMGRTNFGT